MGKHSNNLEFERAQIIKEKIDIFFVQFGSLPMWYQALFVGVVGSIYGLKGVDIFRNSKK